MILSKLALACAISALLFSGCNGSDANQTQSLGNDWIDDAAAPGPGPAGPDPIAPPPAPTTPTSPATPTTDYYSGPEEVAKYVQKFIDDALLQGRNVLAEMKSPKLTIRIASLDSWGSSTIGLCETASNLRRVTFDPDFWNSVSETQRELLAHHEFGHCVLRRGHRSDTLSGGVYASIMYPIIMSSSSYTRNYNYYQQELFSYGALAGDEDAPTVHVCGPDHVDVESEY